MRHIKKKNPRGAGILLHITSLPSRFGCGDFGPGAKKFVRFLKSSGQTFWQILPLGQTDAGHDYSPYSATSSMAVNIGLISPEVLNDEGLLPVSVLNKFSIKPSGTIDFVLSGLISKTFLKIAYERYVSGTHTKLKKQFAAFARKEKNWLDDFAVFTVLTETHHDRPWYQWPDEFRFRNAAALRRFKKENETAIHRQKWYQFIAARQWAALKLYCNENGIRVIGDMPFYVSHDSVDCWIHPNIFMLKKGGEIIGAAGVPPDYFNSNGQLWGMPVFNWNALKKQKYRWWVDRIRKNMELYDVVRLDHFRAFGFYWDVPGDQTTAKGGSWKRGPGIELFKVFSKKLTKLNFIAEDLGTVDRRVFDLRDQLGLPGMKVLQYAFGKDMMTSGFAPHNYKDPNAVVYTGTHDNNTTLGWFREEASAPDRLRLELYLGKTINQKNICEELIRIAYSSIVNIAIIPVQDFFGMDQRYRMNMPSTSGNNWRWRLLPGKLTRQTAARIKAMAVLYNREAV